MLKKIKNAIIRREAEPTPQVDQQKEAKFSMIQELLPIPKSSKVHQGLINAFNIQIEEVRLNSSVTERMFESQIKEEMKKEQSVK